MKERTKTIYIASQRLSTPIPMPLHSHPNLILQSHTGLFAAVLVMALLGLGASEVEVKDKSDKTDPRLFFPIPGTTGTGGTLNNPLLTLGGDSAVYVGLTIAGLTAAVIVLGILLAISVGYNYKNGSNDFFGYSSSG